MPLCVIDGVIKSAFECIRRNPICGYFFRNPKLSSWLFYDFIVSLRLMARRTLNSPLKFSIIIASARFCLQCWDTWTQFFSVFIVSLSDFIQINFIIEHQAQQSIMIRCCLTKLSLKVVSLAPKQTKQWLWLIHKQQPAKPRVVIANEGEIKWSQVVNYLEFLIHEPPEWMMTKLWLIRNGSSTRKAKALRSFLSRMTVEIKFLSFELELYELKSSYSSDYLTVHQQIP